MNFLVRLLLRLVSSPRVSALRSAFVKHTLGKTLAVIGAIVFATPVHATFLIDPTGGTSLTDFTQSGMSDPDNGSLLRSLGGSFSLYGAASTSLYVQTNGFLSVLDGAGFSADRSVGSLAASTTSPVIAPYYDDLYLDDTTSTILEKIIPGSYYSVTYTINGLNDISAANTAKFQAVLFTGDTMINGNLFLAGDIVFSYGDLTNTITDSNFSSGVAQNAANATNAFNNSGGQFASNDTFTSNFNRNEQGLLFRLTPAGGGGGQGTYTQTLVPLAGGSSNLPEPCSAALVGVCLVAWAGSRSKIKAHRRKKAN